MTLSLGPKVKMAYDRNSLRSKRTKVKLAKFKPLYMDLVSVIFSDLAFLRRGVKWTYSDWKKIKKFKKVKMIYLFNCICQDFLH